MSLSLAWYFEQESKRTAEIARKPNIFKVMKLNKGKNECEKKFTNLNLTVYQKHSVNDMKTLEMFAENIFKKFNQHHLHKHCICN